MIFFILVISLLLYIIFLLWRWSDPFNGRPHGIKSVPEIPILGCVMQFVGKNFVEMSEQTWKWAEMMGSPYRAKAFNETHIIVHDADQAEILLKDTDNVAKSGEYDNIMPWLGTGLLLSSGEKWHRRRKLLTPAFHFQILRDFLPIFQEQSSVFTQIVSEKLRSSPDHCVTLDVNPLMSLLTLDVICETAMGTQIEAQRKSSEYLKAIRDYSAVVIRRSISPWYWNDTVFAMTALGRKSAKLLTILHGFTKKVIKERRALRHSNNRDSEESRPQKRRVAFLDLLLDLESDGEIDAEGIREEVDTFMFEGHDTTATALSWVLYCIAAHSDVQEKVRAEAIEVLGPNVEIEPTADELSKLKYMECVMKESQRLFPTVPWIGRQVTHPITIGNCSVEPGMIANISVLPLHRDPKRFPNPLKFDPDRFSAENKVDIHPFAFVPFSAGSRNCIGQKFAILEEKVIISHIVRRYQLKATQEFNDLKPSMEVVLRPSRGIHIQFLEIS